jgi:hypothetical protein
MKTSGTETGRMRCITPNIMEVPKGLTTEEAAAYVKGQQECAEIYRCWTSSIFIRSKWKLIYGKINSSTVSAEVLLKYLFKEIRKIRKGRYEKLNEIKDCPQCILDNEKKMWERVETYEAFVAKHPLARAVKKLKGL